METIIDRARNKFIKMVSDFGSDPYNLLTHLSEVEKWAKYMITKYPEADGEVILLSAWLHDIGHYPKPSDIDHAVRSEQRAKEFLESENYDSQKILKVLHCVRSHRCSDVMPETLEAKIMALIDSASHMTDSVYFRMAKDDKEKKENFKVYGKMERDLRELSAFPEVRKKLTGLYDTWEKLIKEYEKLELN